MNVRLGLIAAAALLLAACNSSKNEPAAKAAEGEVLPGSVSDAMLPYDTVTSAPPLEAPGAGARDGSASSPDRSTTDTSATDAVQQDDGDEPEPEAT